jgi:hypothetical protein
MFESVSMCIKKIFLVASWNQSLNVIIYKQNNERYKVFFQVLVTAYACKHTTDSGNCVFVSFFYQYKLRTGYYNFK